jgi:transketolase
VRDAFCRSVIDLAESDERILILTGDLGYTVWEPFIEQFPKRFLNCGISEAHMVSMAAGLAHKGYRPIVYSIAPFVTSRVHDQIRVDICYHESPVMIIGLGSGYSYGYLGATHHSIEDIALLRPLPGMSIMVPRDPSEVTVCVDWAFDRGGPSYIRLAKNGEKQVVPSVKPSDSIAILKKYENASGMVFVMGHIAAVAIEASILLEERGYFLNVVHISRIKPLPTSELDSVMKGFCGDLFSLEEHNIIGGLGSALSEYVMESGLQPLRFHRFGIQDSFVHFCGDTNHLRNFMGLSSEGIADSIFKISNSKSKAV